MKLKYNFFAQTIIKLLLEDGQDKQTVFSIEGIKLDTTEPLESEISIDYIHELTLLYKNHFNTSHCGLEIIQKLDFKNADFLGPYAFSCASLDEAVKKIYAVHIQLNPLVSYEMFPEEKPNRFVYHLDKIWEAKYPESAREIMEFIMANGLLSSQLLTQKQIRPEFVKLKRDKPDDNSIYAEIFNCPVHFESGENSIVYPPAIMDHKIPSYNPTLKIVLQEFAQKVIREFEQQKDIVSEVKALIVTAGNNSIPKEEDIANQLNISKRTLQKKLQDKNTTYLKILDDFQKEQALSYLQSGTISNKEIAWMLGYNDISNFYRAFKRWTGTTPNAYKAEL